MIEAEVDYANANRRNSTADTHYHINQIKFDYFRSWFWLINQLKRNKAVFISALLVAGRSLNCGHRDINSIETGSEDGIFELEIFFCNKMSKLWQAVSFVLRALRKQHSYAGTFSRSEMQNFIEIQMKLAKISDSHGGRIADDAFRCVINNGGWSVGAKNKRTGSCWQAAGWCRLDVTCGQAFYHQEKTLCELKKKNIFFIIS